MSPGKLLMWFIWKWKQAPHATKRRVYTVNTSTWVIYSTAVRMKQHVFCMETSDLKNMNGLFVLISIQLNWHSKILAKATAVHFSHLMKTGQRCWFLKGGKHHNVHNALLSGWADVFLSGLRLSVNLMLVGNGETESQNVVQLQTLISI